MKLTEDEKLFLTTWLFEVGMALDKRILGDRQFRQAHPHTANAYYRTHVYLSNLHEAGAIVTEGNYYRITQQALDAIGGDN